MNVQRITAVIFLTAVLFGCATGSHIITGQVRPAIDPAGVRVYIDPPAEYETIGIVEASSDTGFTTQAKQDRAVNELKKQAAKIGANGVLLTGAQNRLSGSNGVSSGVGFSAGSSSSSGSTTLSSGLGLFFGSGSNSSEVKSVQGIAIYVTQETEPEAETEE